MNQDQMQEMAFQLGALERQRNVALHGQVLAEARVELLVQKVSQLQAQVDALQAQIPKNNAVSPAAPAPI